MIDRRQVLAWGGLGALAGLAPPAWDARSGPIVSKVVMEDQRLWIAVSIAASKPMLFVIDTGAGLTAIRPEIAKSLHLKATGGITVGGLGKKRVLSDTFLAHDVILGGSLRQPEVAFFSYDFARGLPADAAGLFAAGLITTRDSDLDFDKDEWRVWPDGRPGRDGFTALDSSIGGNTDRAISSHRMTATAMLNGKPYRFLLDTGAPNGLLLLPDAARRSGLFDDTVPFAPARTSGFGGHAAKLSRTVRANGFSLGPLSIDRPLVNIMDPDQRDRIDHDGLIGLPLISLLNLSTDIGGRKLWVQRNQRPMPRFSYNLAGFWVDPDKSGATMVMEVGTRSPAAAAGIRQGDIVTDPPTLQETIQRMAGGPGKVVKLGIKRDGVVRQIEFTLRPYL
jgi:hypothetical protein